MSARTSLSSSFLAQAVQLDPQQKPRPVARRFSRDTQGVIRMLSNSGKDPRLLLKKALVHALAHLDIGR